MKLNKGEQLVFDESAKVVTKDLITIAQMVEDGKLSSTAAKILIKEMPKQSEFWAYFLSKGAKL